MTTTRRNEQQPNIPPPKESRFNYTRKNPKLISFAAQFKVYTCYVNYFSASTQPDHILQVSGVGDGREMAMNSSLISPNVNNTQNRRFRGAAVSWGSGGQNILGGHTPDPVAGYRHYSMTLFR